VYDFLTKLPTSVNKNILIKFMTAETVVAANDLLAINCENKSLHRSNSELIIGAETRAAAVKLNEGAQQEVYENIIHFYITAFQYPTTILPYLHEDLYKHCEVADVQLCVSAKFSSVCTL